MPVHANGMRPRRHTRGSLTQDGQGIPELLLGPSCSSLVDAVRLPKKNDMKWEYLRGFFTYSDTAKCNVVLLSSLQ